MKIKQSTSSASLTGFSSAFRLIFAFFERLDSGTLAAAAGGAFLEPGGAAGGLEAALDSAAAAGFLGGVAADLEAALISAEAASFLGDAAGVLEGADLVSAAEAAGLLGGVGLVSAAEAAGFLGEAASFPAGAAFFGDAAEEGFLGAAGVAGVSALWNQ